MTTASDVMSQPVTTITPGTAIGEMIRTVRAQRFSGLPVVDADGRAVGLVSQNDVLRALARRTSGAALSDDFQSGKRKAGGFLIDAVTGDDAPVALGTFLDRPVRDVMTQGIVDCSPSTPLQQVCDLMTERHIHRVVVVDGDERIVGLISASDLVRHLGETLH